MTRGLNRLSLVNLFPDRRTQDRLQIGRIVKSLLLWNENQTLSVSATLFVTGNGIGCRGFLKEENRILTWEMLITLKQQAIKGDNVISFTRRKR